MEEIQDDVLLDLINSNDENAYMYIINKYTPSMKLLIKKEINSAKKIGLEYDDLMQEAILGLTKAINTYDREKDNKFSTYAEIVIKRHIKNHIKKFDNNNNLILNESVYFNDELKKDLEQIDNAKRPDDSLNGEALNNEIINVLSDQECKVYELKKENKTNKEIANILNQDDKNIENTITRIHLKVKNILEKL